ncbi:MATE family efflux transporter [Balneatrix alpica]|uniref:Multidrug-efflux transporter n=1 Tax=Balneatrix alpica TaxID=75684 RepID=A0ABV5Z752_9GAMM|nr:MATE family efflux transporter [Balneatrix alpica]
MIGMLSQSLLNLVDTALVGPYGEVALAGVGLGGYVAFLAASVLLGLAAGVQGRTARFLGRQQPQLFAPLLSSACLLALLLGTSLTLLMLTAAPWLLNWLNPSAEVQHTASSYLFWRLLALPAVALNLVFRGFFHGQGSTLAYLKWLAALHGLNILLSLVLVKGYLGLPEWGPEGAGLGTFISLWLGCGIFAWRSWRQTHSRWAPCWRTGKGLIRTLIPHSTQQLFFAFGLMLMFWVIGLIGTREQAVAHVLVNLSLLLILPGVGTGIACTTLINQDLGRQQQDSAFAWGVTGVRLAFILLALLALPLWLFSDSILALFLHQPELIALAQTPLKLTALMLVLDAAALVLNQALLGCGSGKTAMQINIASQWLFFLPFAWLFGPVLGGGLVAIWLVHFVQRCLSSVLFLWIWHKRNWQYAPI